MIFENIGPTVVDDKRNEYPNQKKCDQLKNTFNGNSENHPFMSFIGLNPSGSKQNGEHYKNQHYKNEASW